MVLRRIAGSLLAAAAFVTAGLGADVALAQDVARGEYLFQICIACHGESGAGNQLYAAPAIAGLDEWYVAAQLQKFRSGVRGAHFDDTSGMRMRPMARAIPSDEDAKAVAAYVAGLPTTRPAATLEGIDPVRGQALYAPCIACHGIKGEGMRPLNGPRLTNIDDWYLLEQLKKFKSGVRGGNPADATGILMRPMAIQLVDEQAMKDVVAHIATLTE